MELTVNCARKTGHPHGKINKIKPIYIILHKKVNSQKNKDLNMKFETVQLLEETISSSLHDYKYKKSYSNRFHLAIKANS